MTGLIDREDLSPSSITPRIIECISKPQWMYSELVFKGNGDL